MDLLYILLIVLVATRSLGEVAARIGQPVLVGELVGGVLLGVVARTFEPSLPVLSGLTDNEVFVAISDLGVFFLMLLAGLEMHPRDLRESSKGALGVAIGGMVIPLLCGLGLGWAYLPDSEWRLAQILFLGTCLAITALPVAVKVLLDMGRLDTRSGKMVVSAALFDDVFGLILLGVLTGLLRTGELPDAAGVALLVGRVVAFFAACFVIGKWVFPFVGRHVARLEIDELEFSLLLVFGLGLALLAELFHLHFILGAFLAGLFFTRRTIERDVFAKVEKSVRAVTSGFLAPVFFASIGLHLDVAALWNVPLFVVLLVTLAVVSKLVGAGFAARWVGLDRRESAAVGLAMSARGAVELIVAGIALEAGLFDRPDPAPPIISNLFSAIVIMAIATTLFTPISLRWVLGPTKDD